MSQRRPRDPPTLSTTSSPSERVAPILTTHLPPLPMQNVVYQQVPYAPERRYSGGGQFGSGTNILPPLQSQPGLSNQRVVVGNVLAQSSPPHGISSQNKRRPGAAPLADILLQNPPSPPNHSPSSSTSEMMQISPTTTIQPNLSLLGLHQGPSSPHRTRQEYFDPLRSALAAEIEGRASRAEASGSSSSAYRQNILPHGSATAMGSAESLSTGTLISPAE